MALIPTGPLTWLDDATGLPRVALGNITRLNYLNDAAEWAPICADWVFQSPSLYYVNAGEYRVTAHSQARIIESWKTPMGLASFQVQPSKLYRVRNSDHQLTALASAGNPIMSANGRQLICADVFPGIDARVIYDEDALTMRFIFHQSARDDIAAQGPWEGYSLGIATEIDLTGSDLNWRNKSGPLTIDGTGAWGIDYFELYKNGTGVVAIKGGGVLHSSAGDSNVAVTRWLAVIQNKLYLVELVDPLLMATLPAGNVSHNATFGNTGEEATTSSIANAIVGTNFTIGENGTGISVSAYIDRPDPGSDLLAKCAVYEGAIMSNNLTLVTNGATAAVSIPVEALAWYTFNFSAAPSFVSGTVYTLVAWGQYNLYSGIFIRRGVASSGTYRLVQSQTYDGWPNPLNAYGLTNSIKCSIYCTYTPAGTPVKRLLALLGAGI